MTHPKEQAATDTAAASPAEFGTAANLIRSIIATRTTSNERLEQPDVRDAAETIGRYVSQAPSSELRLEAASLLGKAHETFNSRDLTITIASLLRRELDNPLPPIASWGNADDRKYLAKAVALSDAKWVAQYAAQALAQAEINEKVSRDSWAELAINRAEDLASALRVVARAATAWLSDRSESAELAYRKLRRISDALAQTLGKADIPSGKEFGGALVSLVRLATGGAGDSPGAREEAAVSALDLVVQILRLRFESLFDSDIYRAVGTVRGWWRPGRPPEHVERRSDRIASLAMQGLHILARQGVQDRELRIAVAQSLDVARVNQVGQEIAAGDPSLDPAASRFLASGKDLVEARSNESIQELNEQASDELLGRLLLTATNPDVGAEVMTSVADAIELFEPMQASIVRKAGLRLDLIRQSIDALASKRRLAIYASRGELVQYDPALHDTDQRLQRLGDARVVTPGVIRIVDGRLPLIVIRAIVEKR